MKRRRAAIDLLDLVVYLAMFLIIIAFLYPTFSRAKKNTQRANCQLNQKQIAFALLQYAADNDGDLPRHNWVAMAKPYVKDSAVFRCPSKGAPIGGSDYFFNDHLFKKQLENIKSPQTLILMGDGNDDKPLSKFPSAWLKDENSPAWRHIEGANYCFADGHIKWLTPDRVLSDFRVVNP